MDTRSCHWFASEDADLPGAEILVRGGVLTHPSHRVVRIAGTQCWEAHRWIPTMLLWTRTTTMPHRNAALRVCERDVIAQIIKWQLQAA